MVYSTDFKIFTISLYKNTSFMETYKIVKTAHPKFSTNTLCRWIEQDKNDTLTVVVKRNRKSVIAQAIKDFIIDYVKKYNTFNHKELIKLIKKRFNVTIRKSMIYKLLKQLNYCRLRMTYTYNIKSCDNYAQMLNTLKEKINSVNQDKIISIDEMSVNTHIKPNYKWLIKGSKARGFVNTKSYKKHTLTMAITNKKILHIQSIDGSSNAQNYILFIKGLLTKYKNLMRKNGTVNEKCYLFMDNARIHHAKIFNEFIKDKNCEIIYNIPYSPQYNPIEGAFGQTKFYLRMCDNNEDESKLMTNIRHALKKITPNHLQNYFTNSFRFD